MEAWEIATIEYVIPKEQPKGWGKDPVRRYAAMQLTGLGKKKMYETPNFPYTQEDDELAKLIGQLASEGWEPMPVNSGNFSSTGGYLRVTWYFKRKIAP
jgi:hypothetical protein